MKAQVNLRDHATLVILNCSFSWGTITDKQITEEVNDDKHTKVKSALRVRKTLLPAASGVYVEAVRAALSSFYQYHTSRTYSTPVVGQRIMPVAFYPEYMRKYGEAQALSLGALAALKENYEAAIEQARDLLQGGFNIKDYPPVDEIDHYYTLNVRWLPIPKGDDIMNALGTSVAAGVDQYVQEVMQTAADDAKLRLRKAVERMAERLQSGGKLYATVTESLDDLAVTLPEIAGLAQDPQLQSIVEEVRGTLMGYDVDAFKKNDKLRSQVGDAAAAILAKLQ